MSTFSKDEKIESLQLKQNSLFLQANLVTAVAQDAQIVTIGPTLAARLITIDLKEPAKKVQKVSITNRATGAIIATVTAPALTDTVVNGVVVSSQVAFTCNGTDNPDAVIEIQYSK